MGKSKRKHSRDGDQGRLQKPDKTRAVDHEPPQNHGQKQALEDSPRELQSPQSTNLPPLEGMLQKDQMKPTGSIASETRLPPDTKVEEKPIQAADHLSQKSESMQVVQAQEVQVQNKANGERAHFQPQLIDSTQGQQHPQSRPEGSTAATEMMHSKPHMTETGQTHSREQIQSEAMHGTAETAGDELPKNNGKRSVFAKAWREKFYSSSQEKKAASDRARLLKEPDDRKRHEDATRDQKGLPLKPPEHSTAQKTPYYSQSIPKVAQGLSDAPSARQSGSRPSRGTSQQEGGTSRIEAVRNQGFQIVDGPRSREDIDAHAWERHLPQSADDATIQNEVLTLFEFIDNHVENYYCDVDAKILQVVSDRLIEIQSPYLPDGASLEELLVFSRYKTPIIKHCLINLVVSSMSFQESSSFPLLPDEFTILARALRKETVDTHKKLYHDQAFSKFRLICVFLCPSAQQDPIYTKKLDDTISRAVALCLNAFAPWGTRDSTPEERRDHLISLFHQAARVGVLLFSQPSTFLFDWSPLQRAHYTSAVQVWPRLLRTTNQNAEPLSKRQVIVEGSSQDIGMAIMTSHPVSGDLRVLPSRQTRDPVGVHDEYGKSQQETYFARSPPSHTFGSPSELPASPGLVSATIRGPHDSPYPYNSPNYSAQPDADMEHRNDRSPQKPPHAYNPLKDPEHRSRDREEEHRGGNSSTKSPQPRPSNEDTYGSIRPNPIPRKPVYPNQAEFQELAAS